MKTYKIMAKPIRWEFGPSIWNDNQYGFYIVFDPHKLEYKYEASWCKGDSEEFETLGDAQAWCKEKADSWISDNVEIIEVLGQT